MGCKASKEPAVTASPSAATPAASNRSSGYHASTNNDPASNTSSPPVTKRPSGKKKRPSPKASLNSQVAPPSAHLLQILLKERAARKGNVSGLWPKVIQMCERDPLYASYQHPQTKNTPLHVACSMVDMNDGTQDISSAYSVVSAIRALLKGGADSLSKMDNKGCIPLHYVMDPVLPPGNAPSRWKIRSAVFRLLVGADYEASTEYLSRNDVQFASSDEGLGACSPLYFALYNLPDEFYSPAPTVDFISVVHDVNPSTASVSNISDGDKPLALLYRRFTRQFDLSEKFFAGDNSRPEVVEHRRKYKMAAGNTWKIIELLLRPESIDEDGDWLIVHRAVQIDTPPDLLRYIVETNAEELTQVDEHGNLPLHYAAKSMPHSREKRESFPSFHSKYVVDELLYKFPNGASIADAEGRYPLTLAVDTGKQWVGGGVKSLYDAYPDALQQIDVDSNPSLQKALSYMDDDRDSNTGEEQLKQGVVKDELYDAIMLVQKPNVDVTEVVSSMWAHEEDAGVQMMGCIAISKLASTASDKDVLRIALSAVPATVNAMKAHPNEPAVQEKACNALKKMATADGKREVSFVASGAIAAIVGAMQAHVVDPVVQEEACGALADIVIVGGADRATIVASVSGFTAILNALAAHPNVKMVQKEGCRTLQAVTEYPQASLPELPRSQTEPLLESAREKYPAECSEAVGIILSRLT